MVLDGIFSHYRLSTADWVEGSHKKSLDIADSRDHKSYYWVGIVSQSKAVNMLHDLVA